MPSLDESKPHARGGNRQPRALRVLNGNPGKHPMPPEIPVEPGCPDPPKSLKGAALLEWRLIVPQLVAVGLLTRIDRSALIAYCRAFARAEAAEEYLDNHGTVYETPQGLICKRPQLAIASDAWARCHRFIVEFGLSPASRTKVSVAKKPEDPKGASEFFQ